MPALLLVLVAPTADLDLAGPRGVRGTVAVADDRYTVDVSFRAVAAFDPVTNEQVNRDLGHEYAARLLARHLKATDTVTVAGGRIEAEGTKDGRFRLRVSFPTAGVTVGKVEVDPPPGPPPRAVRPAAFADKLFTAKQDHLDTLAGLEAALAAGVRQARTIAGEEKPDARRPALARGLAAVENRGTAALDALAAAVAADRHLFDATERPEVNRAVAAARGHFMAALKAAAAAGPLLPLTQFKDVQLADAFADWLRADPLLMEVGGAAVCDDPAGPLLLGVAKVLLKDGGPTDRARAERVGVLKARVAAVGERDGSRISFLKRVEHTVTLVDGEPTESVESRTKLTSEQIGGWARGLPVVGRWTAADGSAVYFAVGGRRADTGKPSDR